MHMGIGRDKGRVTVVVPFQAVATPCCSIESHWRARNNCRSREARHARSASCGLAGPLSWCGPRLARYINDLRWRFCPTIDKRDVIRRRVSDLPIDLGDVIIDPTLLYPIGDIGVEVVVVLQTVGMLPDPSAVLFLLR